MAITRRQALDCFRSDDLIGMGMEADAVRRTLHPENAVTYVLDCRVCVTAANRDARLADATDAGATGLTLCGSLPSLSAWESLLADLRARFPSLWLHGLSATQVATLADEDHLSIEDTLQRLKSAGIQSLSGEDAGMLPLSDPDRCSMEAWLATHRAAHLLGLSSIASMLFGKGETPEHRFEHLEALHRLQQETGGFLAFRPVAAPLPNFEEATAVEYLTTLAVSRMVLDSIPNIEADGPSQGLKVLQMTLRFGANDVGSTLHEETLTTPTSTTEEDFRRIIRGAGLRPVQRDAGYRSCFLS